MLSRAPSVFIDGPAGRLQCVVEPSSAQAGSLPLAVVCHPHPLHGGSLDNKVAQTLARALVALGYQAVRFNFRGVGQSEGSWDEGRGEVDDALAVVKAFGQPHRPLAVAGFSFGAYVASQVAAQSTGRLPLQRLILVGPAVDTFAMANVPGGTLIVQGQSDEVVPLDSVLRWAQTQSLPVTVMPGTGHFFHGQLGLLKHIVMSSPLLSSEGA